MVMVDLLGKLVGGSYESGFPWAIMGSVFSS